MVFFRCTHILIRRWPHIVFWLALVWDDQSAALLSAPASQRLHNCKSYAVHANSLRDRIYVASDGPGSPFRWCLVRHHHIHAKVCTSCCPTMSADMHRASKSVFSDLILPSSNGFPPTQYMILSSLLAEPEATLVTQHYNAVKGITDLPSAPLCIVNLRNSISQKRLGVSNLHSSARFTLHENVMALASWEHISQCTSSCTQSA